MKWTNTEETKNEADTHLETMKSHNIVIDSAMKQISIKTNSSTLETKSLSSRKSSSNGSKHSSVITRKRAELESSKTKLKFVKEEA